MEPTDMGVTSESNKQMTIRTSGQLREILSWYDLTPREQKEFSYLESNNVRTTEDAKFVKYRGQLYDLGEFVRTSNLPVGSPLRNWDGYHSDSYFSGIVCKYRYDGESVVMGSYFC